MKRSPELIDVFAGIVAKINGDETDNYGTFSIPMTLTEKLRDSIGDNYRAVQYYAGHPKEIIEEIRQKDGTSLTYEKFPAVCLFLDTLEQHGQKAWAYDANNLQLVILHYTEQEYTTMQRHEATFKPVLIPIYRELIRQIARIGVQVSEELVRHTKINHYFWGKEGLYGVEGNIFNDFLDCIEIRSLQLSINYQTQCP